MSTLEQKIAFSMMPGASDALYRYMEDSGLTLDDFFSMPMSTLSETLELKGLCRFENSVREEALFRAAKEIEFMHQHNVEALFIGDEAYPQLLLDLNDAPVVVYKLGDCDLNANVAISVVGTRRCTPYGVEMVSRVISDLAAYFPEMPVVSGLAYGIDAAAHNAALSNGLPTVAVLAHGLNMIYPSAHRGLAGNIVKAGGALLTEYPSGTKPFRQHFLARNRIVAGLTPVTLVAESAIKGGAMSTANDAFSYNREVVAFPGRAGDVESEGCNHLIRCQKSCLVVSALDIMEVAGWQPAGVHVDARQRNLFPELTDEDRQIYDFLRFKREPQSLDMIHAGTGLGVGMIMSRLSELEFDGVVVRYPGNRFGIV